MKIALLTKHYEPHTPFGIIVKRLVEYLVGRGHKVGIILAVDFHKYLSDYDLAISYFYPHILKEHEFNAPKYGTFNVHIGALPYGRGAMPNVWSIVDDFPAGIAIHKMDSGIDTGDVISRALVKKLPTDTGETLYWRLVTESCAFFLKSFPSIEQSLLNEGGLFGIKQVGEYLTYRARDVNRIDDLESVFGHSLAHQFVNILRARTFAGHESAYIYDEHGRKVFVRVSLASE